MGESHQQLLLSLKIVVEGLLSSEVANIWNVYGGLSRLHGVLEKIFKHEFSVFKQDGEEDCWIFIQGLSWLRPNLASSPTPVSVTSPPPHPHVDKAMIWLHNSLETHNLSEKLSWLVSDEQHLASCYNRNAFLRQPEYAEATLICLRALEQNQLSLLTDIHPSLYLSRRCLKAQDKAHRRCSSFPDGFHQRILAQKPYHFSMTSTELSTILSRVKVQKSTCIIESSLINLNSGKKRKSENNFLYQEKPWKSLPCIATENQLPKVKTEPSSVPLTRKCENKVEHSCLPEGDRENHWATNSTRTVVTKLSPSVLKVDYNETEREASELIKLSSKKFQRGKNLPYRNSSRIFRQTSLIRSNGENVEMLRKKVRTFRSLNHKNITCSTPCLQESTDTDVEGKQSFTLPRSNQNSVIGTPRSSSFKLSNKKSLMEDGGYDVQPMRIGFFPKPHEGQSLSSFLSSNQFLQTNAELDRENAHFSISEAIIATIEQVKCSRWESLVDETIEESDEEIKELKQRIRLRRRQKQEEKRQALWTMPLSDTTTTDQSVSSLSSSSCRSSDSLSTEGVDDLEVDKVTLSNLEDMNNSGLSLSMASLYSEADLSRRPVASTSSECISSAESVALSLLKRFSDKQLPRASEIQWLVSEKEAPQQLLPMPNSWAVNPDDAEEQDMRNATALRGTTQWAPPRRQIIFTTHPPPQRKVIITKQQFRCAGCGMKVEPRYAHRFRYCEYLGRYFCTGCHKNRQALIPARILWKWDFGKYPVSDFSYSLLEHIANDPLFSVSTINSGLYKHVKVLERVRQIRYQLFTIKDFLLACRFAEGPQESLKQECVHVISDPEMYSIQDFAQVKSGELFQRLQKLFLTSTSHIAECELCQARGFMCELCRSQDVIYPWQLSKVNRCLKCGACYHSTCLKPQISCPRCDRILARSTSTDTKS